MISRLVFTFIFAKLRDAHLPGFFILVCGIFIFSCENKEKKIAEENGLRESIVTGRIKNLKGNIFLKKVVNEKLITIDSILPDDEGNFKLVAAAAEPDFYVLSCNDSLAQLIILDSEKVEVNADVFHFNSNFNISGSKASRDYIDFNKKITQRFEEENKVKKAIPQLINKNDLDSLKLIEQNLKAYQQRTAEFVKNYTDSIVPSLAVFNLIGYLSIEKDFDYLMALSKKMEKQLPKSKYTKLFSNEMYKMVSMQQKLQESGVAIGSNAPEISLPDPGGKLLSLSSLKGKYVLLDFWASWCGPCRAENPNVVRLYHKYKDKNFDILSVSLDKDRAPWLAAISKDGLSWNHVSDLKFWNSSVVPLYGIEGIPATYLLDKDGKVIAKNLRGEDLENALNKLLK